MKGLALEVTEAVTVAITEELGTIVPLLLELEVTVPLVVPAGVTVMDGEGPGADGLGKGDEPGGGIIPIAKLWGQ
jgi:hypothetical protein